MIPENPEPTPPDEPSKLIRKGMVAKGLRLATSLVISAVGMTTQSWAQSCLALQEQGRLLDQLLQTSKTCTTSTAKSWTDCVFEADGTRLHLVKASGREGPRAYGASRSGFYVVAVDPRHFVRPVVDRELGLVLRVEDKSLIDEEAHALRQGEEARCRTNSALLTLDGRVLNEEAARALRARIFDAMPQDLKVRRLQQGLIALGLLDGPADGILGQKTQAALDAFRQQTAISRTMPDDLFPVILAIEAARAVQEDPAPTRP